jgi:hypothetical protein
MTDHASELARQVDILLAKGYPALAGLDEAAFIELLGPLGSLLPEVEVSGSSHVPFLLVVPHTLVPTVAAVERFAVRGRTGWTDMADEISSYLPIEGVEVPDSPYLLVDVSTGPETLDVPPGEALPMICGAGRTPLTVDEGVALMTQFPESLTERNAFQALASRADNKRVPSFWMSKGAPRLGWCWEGNPHSWLGSASAAQRLAINTN